MIIIDSREKEYTHIKTSFDEMGVEYCVKALPTGDYINTSAPGVIIDRKADLQEVCSNLSKGKSNISRFTKECRRAFDEGVRFIVLIEGTNCTKIQDVMKWQSKYSAHTGKWLVNEMFRLTMAYKVEWMFCKKNETAQKILELLNYDTRRD